MYSREVSRASTALVVTADREFADACERHLDGVDLRVTAADTVGEAIDVFATADRVDCIVSDHNLPDTDGIAFLEIVRSQFPQLPFVLVASSGSEAIASRAISADVTEYLIRGSHDDQWDRLARIVENAVASYRYDSETAGTETRARDLLDAVQDPIAIVRGDRIEYVNSAGVTLLGADDRADVIGRHVGRTLSIDDETGIVDTLTAVQTADSSLERVEGRLARVDGTTLPVEITAARGEWMSAPVTVLVVRDISERKEYEDDIELKDRAIDEAPIGITIADASEPDNPLIYANAEFERLTGYPVEGAFGRNCRFLQGEDTDPEPVAAMREAVDAEEPVSVELRNYRADGTEFWNRVSIAPVEDADGDVTHYVGFQEDITERKENEAKLRRFRQAVEAAGYAIYITDTDGTIEYVNPAFERITGYAGDEAVGKTPRILNSGEMDQDFYDELWETVLDGDVWEGEIRDRRASGELYYARQTIAPVTDDDGDTTAFVAIQTDVTEQREREAKLRQYERAIEGANELIAAVDDDYRYLFANPAYREFHGPGTDDLTGETLPDVLGPDMFEDIRPYIDRALAGDAVHYRMSFERPDRPGRTFDVQYYPLEGGDGTVQGVVATLRDLTEQIERETHLATLDRMLRHNLHNELNVVLGRAEMIGDQSSGEVAGHAETIESAAERLIKQADKEREIVQLLTEVSTPTTIDVVDVVERVVDRVGSAYPGAEIAVEAPGSARLTTIPELERAVEEVVENAVLHADRDPPEVTVGVERYGETVEVRVADTGPGIPPEEQRVIGDEETIEPLLHSDGMGLWLVKRIITRAGGTINFGERPTRGSVVTLLVPRGGATETVPPES